MLEYLVTTSVRVLDTEPRVLRAAFKRAAGKLHEFIREGHVRRLLIRADEETKEQPAGELKAVGSREQKVIRSLSVHTEVQYAKRRGSSPDGMSVVFIKSLPTIDASKPLAGQVFLCQLKDSAPYEAILNYVRHAFLPYSRSIMSHDKGDEKKDVDFHVLRAVNSKLSELEVSLLRCQRSIEIPQIMLQVHPTIQSVVDAKAARGQKATVDDLPPLQDRDKFLNELQNMLGDWKKLISSVTKLDRDVASGSTKEEAHFWMSMERTLTNIKKQLLSPGVAFTFTVLNANQRFLATTGFREECNLTQCEEKVKVYTDLLRDFPIRKLIEAVTINDLKDSITLVFKHLKHVNRIKYPLRRAVALVHTVSRDIAVQLRGIINAKKPMLLSYDDFNKATKDCRDLFRKWSTQLDLFFDDLRALVHRSEDRSKLDMNRPFVAFAALQKRIIEVRRLRKEHHELIRVIESTLGNESIVRQSSLKQIDDAYEFLKGVDVMDTSKDESDVWKVAVKAYLSKIEYVEGELEEKIRELLDRAKGDANEMFRVCRKFNDLFVRPRIQAAIREYQQPLIETVKKGINALHEKFKTQYVRSEAYKMSLLKDLPPVSGAIIWLRQIERQLKLYMMRVEDVLGKKWHHHVEGKSLKRTYDLFRNRLEKSIQKDQFEAWVMRWKKPKGGSYKINDQIEMEGRIFRVDMVNQQPSLVINFDKKLVTLFKEVRNLSYIPNMRVPYEIQIQANEAKVKYPFAVRLEEVVRIYNRTCARIAKYSKLQTLAARAKKKVQDLIMWGVTQSIHWTSEVLTNSNYVSKLGLFTQQYQETVDDLILRSEEIDQAVNRLAHVDPERKALEGAVQDIQRIIDGFEKNGYSNLGAWVHQLDQHLETILSRRLRKLMAQWAEGITVSYAQLLEIQTSVDSEAGDDSKSTSGDSDDGNGRASLSEDDIKNREILKIMRSELRRPIEHEIIIRSNVLCLEPPLHRARLRLGQSLQRLLGVVCKLPRLQSFVTRRAMADKSRREQQEALTFSSALTHMATDDMQTCFAKIEEQILAAQRYVDRWLQYQALWDMDVEMVLKNVERNVHCWEQLLRDLKSSRGSIEDSESRAMYGTIVISYKKVQQKVMNKFDSWSKTIVGKFANQLHLMMQKTFNKLSEGRKTLENLSMNFKDTGALITNIMKLQEYKKKSGPWERDVKSQVGVEKMLERQRFIFPPDWLYSERVVGEWNAYQQILSIKLGVLARETPALQKRVTQEDILISERMSKFAADWKHNRPVDGELSHRKVVKSLTLFQTTIDRLQTQLKQMELAKQALEMPVKKDDTLQPIREELHGLQEVWDQLGSVWRMVDTLGEKRLINTPPETIRTELKRMQASVQGLPSHLRTYDAYDYLKRRLEELQKLYVHFVTISSPVLRKKHQLQILKQLKIAKTQWQDLTIGFLWKADLPKHKDALLAIAETAQGESALEEYLAQVATAWEDTQFDLVNYHHKCFLIRNWNDMFKQLTDHLTDLTSMKQSPFFKVFERDALRWEQTLNLAQAILEVFSEVQRRWVYLEGIFTSSVDVQQQLAFQHRRFKTFDRDFKNLMREIKLEPSTLYWFSEKRALLPRLEQYREILTTIQKALAGYLEKQRAQFPRFYFVGDDDLLEIIGNAKDPVKVLRHMPKMFAGITSLQLSDDFKTILGMASREGEQVAFKDKINASECKTIHDWLRRVEINMRIALASQLEVAVAAARKVSGMKSADIKGIGAWVEPGAAQAVLLSSQVDWSTKVHKALVKVGNADKPAKTACNELLTPILSQIQSFLKTMAERILLPMSADQRKKYEQLITELVHQRDVTRALVERGVRSETDYFWLANLRFAFDTENKELEEKLRIMISRATFHYGFEYLGVGERLVQTPLTDRCYLTLCEALHMRMGGNPFGPAGTGKTESVKMLGSQLGRFVLVFCCDESFDLAAMGRIFVGLCQCGAWGCFDEFNRLEERILSAVSQQIQLIQQGLRKSLQSITLAEKEVQLNHKMGIFVTMNPGYAGRSNLPDNLKQLFRGMAMMKPDRNLIAQVTLYSQGFRTAEYLSSKVVLLFQLCKDQLSDQSHYDFGLRSLKSVLRSAGVLKREDMHEQKRGESTDWKDVEQGLLVKSMCMTVVPKLVEQDLGLFRSLLSAVFPNAKLLPPSVATIRRAVVAICKERNLLPCNGWVNKIMELNQVQSINHGVIMVGPSGSGKTTAWRVLLEALERVDKGKVKSECHVIDPKAINKDELYGTLDPTTLEWTNGVFTHILRKILDDVRGEGKKRHWIVFDGDVDPEWAENLNSVLDDNKLLTLPNGERIMLSDNIRVMFEVESLNYATPATVSRCGMVWFNTEVVSMNMVCANLLQDLRTRPIKSVPDSVYRRWSSIQAQCCDVIKEQMNVTQREDVKTLDELSSAGSPLIDPIFAYCSKQANVMPLQRMRVMGTLFSLLAGGVARVMNYNDNHPDFPLSSMQLGRFMQKYIVMSIVWAFGGSMSLRDRMAFCRHLSNLTTQKLPDVDGKGPTGGPLIDFDVRVDTGEWEKWEDNIAQVELEPEKIPKPDVVIDTVDTYRHSVIIGAAVADHRPLILCGPPGSGKSMTLTAVLRSLPQFELVTLNFSSSTDPQLLLKTLSHYCATSRTPRGLVMRPTMQDKWLVVFCDEINLPTADAYNTQSVITFLRQLVEQGGFWDARELAWVTLERVQIIGACNPPTDAGRVAMSPRFLRHSMLLFVDFPAEASLKQIYGTFNRALVKRHAALKAFAGPLTDAMVEFYQLNQGRFTPDIQPHYIYSPRELSRWVRAMYEAMDPSKMKGHTLLPEDLARLFAHEALRLFQDRLVEVKERVWVDQKLNNVVRGHFPSVDSERALARPILFSEWLNKRYVSVDQEELRKHVLARLHTFNEEELDVKLVVFDEVLEHILRIDRVLRQPLGHLLLVGASGSGKTILSKFVSWMNGMKVFQIKVHKMYTTKNFNEDLRGVLIRSGCKHEKICFIFDESNVLDTAFLEQMNALLASGEVPGLFEDADFANLMQECKEMGRREGEVLGSDEERYKRFCKHVQRNLHVVFTMNPSNEDFDNRSATSPALFNRCVIDWFGEWSKKALYQVGFDFTRSLDLGDVVEGEEPGDEIKTGMLEARPGSQRDSVVNTMVFVHESVQNAMEQLAKARNGRATFVTPRHYLDFIQHYKILFLEKRELFEEQQRHLQSGLQKLKQTESTVETMRAELNIKNQELQDKEREAKQKMGQIQKDSIEAENQKQASLKMKQEQDQQDKVIEARRSKVQADLDKAGPALEEAQNSVRNIDKKSLDQIKGFRKPPKLVKLAMEPVIMMVNGTVKGAENWATVRKALARSDFIPRILSFNTRNLKEEVAVAIKRRYLRDENFTFKAINRASSACGPLVKWVRSQIMFATVLNGVEPMERELKALQVKSNVLKEQQKKIASVLDNITDKIRGYSEEYKTLISDATKIEEQLRKVRQSVNRSVRLLTNLASEKERWELDRKEYAKQISTVVGDTLLSAAFLAYIGYFNQGYRKTLWDMWVDQLSDYKVETKIDLSVIEYLSLPSQRLEWKEHLLPNDSLCFENSIMMSRFNRYPLIIDPSGQAIAFLMDFFNNRKASKRNMIRTSFLDNMFLKHLESALRFGNALLVEDVENIDPVLNPVLNREIFKSGGRVMITVGAKEIDFSPHFTIFLSTRDPTCHFTPDLCSRVTFVNFTATHASLASQCLNKVLKSERPEIDEKRSDLLKLQGEFKVQLRLLERQLLSALNSVKTNILEDDKVMLSLETLKTRANDVGEKMRNSEQVMEQVQDATRVYEGFARSMAQIYFTLEELSNSHFLYQFSLPFFLQLVEDCLEAKTNRRLGGMAVADRTDPAKRLATIRESMFHMTYRRVGRGLLQKDQMAFALRLAQIALGARAETRLDFNEVNFLLKVQPSAVGLGTPDLPKGIELERAQSEMLGKLCKLPGFKGLMDHMRNNVNEWATFLSGKTAVRTGLARSGPARTDHKSKDTKGDSAAVSTMPHGWEGPDAGQGPTYALRRMLISKVVRPESLEVLSREFVTSVFGSGFFEQLHETELDELVSVETRAGTPLLLVTFPGYDSSERVTSLADRQGMGQKCVSLAMGSPEGYAQADTAINVAAQKGHWVLLKNVHLAPGWLSTLEKRLHRLEPHAAFRIFMTMELSPKVPTSLVRMSTVVIFEPPRGIKSSLLRIFSSLPQKRVDRAPAERSRLYFLLAWLHSVILERLRYVPMGWTKAFEFSEADQKCGMDALDEWVDRMAADRRNVRPDRLPWDAMRASLQKIVYGGRIDNVFDQERLDAFVGQLFCARSYSEGFELAKAFNEEKQTQSSLLTIPDCHDYTSYYKWIRNLDEVSSPELLGLPANSKVLLQREQAKRILFILNRLQSGDHDVERASIVKEPMLMRRRSITSNAPPWWSRVKALVSFWLERLPADVKSLKRGGSGSDTTSSALVRCLQREVQTFRDAHARIMRDLKGAAFVFEGKQAASNATRAVLKVIGESEQVPSHWDPKPKSVHMSASNWMTDFVARVKEINNIASTPLQNVGSQPIWLGGLFAPEAFVAASRQEVAHIHKCSLDSLQLKVTISTSASPLQDDFIFSGLTLQGAACRQNRLTLTDNVEQLLPFAHFQWCKIGGARGDTAASTAPDPMRLPVYLDATRKTFLFSIELPRQASVSAAAFSQRGTCAIAWSPPA